MLVIRQRKSAVVAPRLLRLFYIQRHYIRPFISIQKTRRMNDPGSSRLFAMNVAQQFFSVLKYIFNECLFDAAWATMSKKTQKKTEYFHLLCTISIKANAGRATEKRRVRQIASFKWSEFNFCLLERDKATVSNDMINRRNCHGLCTIFFFYAVFIHRRFVFTFFLFAIQIH